MKIDYQLKYFRQQKGLTQEDIATKLNVSIGLVNRWETGESCPDINTAVKLCALLDVTLGELVKGREPFKFPFDVGIMYTRKRLLIHFISNFVFYVFFTCFFHLYLQPSLLCLNHLLPIGLDF